MKFYEIMLEPHDKGNQTIEEMKKKYIQKSYQANSKVNF